MTKLVLQRLHFFVNNYQSTFHCDILWKGCCIRRRSLLEESDDGSRGRPTHPEGVEAVVEAHRDGGVNPSEHLEIAPGLVDEIDYE